MNYRKTELINSIRVDNIYTVHYFEYMRDFLYPGEHHDFWEIVYADKKSLIITAENENVRLDVGQLYIHKPGEFHNVRPDEKNTANSVIFTFDCSCPELQSVAGRVIECSADDKRTLGGIIREAQNAFRTPLGDPYTEVMECSDSREFGSLQMIGNYIEQLLISIIRQNKKNTAYRKTQNSKLLTDICEWLCANIDRELHFSDISEHFNISNSVIKKTFREQLDCGAMEYFTRAKIDAAKQMILENDLNFTEIANKLAFKNSQYFSTVFKRVTGMTPKEYSISVKSTIR